MSLSIFSNSDRYQRIRSHCSAIVKVLPDLSDIYVAHNTWAGYKTMLRQMKVYRFPFNSLTTNNSDTMMFSSYPGTVTSTDDYYISDQELVVVETTNDVYTTELYKKYITITTVPYWIRVTVATRMANSSPSWHALFYRYNSGTYNNQWITVDFKLFTPGQPLVNDTFWVSEQIPGYYRAEDQTEKLQFDHWPSYNVPFYPDIYNMSGYPDMFAKHGDEYSYQLCARAKIFRRDAVNVESVGDLQLFMQENNYGQGDVLAPDPTAAISARWDLMPDKADRSTDGGIDSKIATRAMVKGMALMAVSGPTRVKQPEFTWAGEWDTKARHYGQPTSFAFPWVAFDCQL